MSTGKVLAVGAALIASLAVATSIGLNPPSDNRARAMDSERIGQLHRIYGAINNHYRLHQKLPTDLEELKQDNSYVDHKDLFDPGTGKPFEYEIIDEKNYRLCAIFERNTDEKRSLINPSFMHKAGRNCFDYKVN